MDAATKTGLNALKSATEKAVHKAAEATGEFIRNKIADKIVNAKPVSEKNSRNVEEIIIPSEKTKETLNELRQSS